MSLSQCVYQFFAMAFCAAVPGLHSTDVHTTMTAPKPARRVSEPPVATRPLTKEEERYKKAIDVVLGEPSSRMTADTPVRLTFSPPAAQQDTFTLPSPESFYVSSLQSSRPRSLPSSTTVSGRSSFKPVPSSITPTLEPKLGMCCHRL